MINVSIITLDNISKKIGDQTLLKEVSFSIADKERVAFIGMNGAGKSTLLKIIAGLEQADHGQIHHAKGFQIEYLPQNPVFQAGSNVMEHIFQGDAPIIKLIRTYETALYELQQNPEHEEYQKRVISLQQQMDSNNAWDVVTKAKSILSKLGIQNLQQQIEHLSGGQRKRVAMAAALIHPVDLLILDEPTNHIDIETTLWLEEHLSKYSGSLLLVTHDRYFLNQVTNRILELDHGEIYNYEGNYEYFLDKKAERIEMEQATEAKRENILRRELAWLRRGAKARTTKQKARKDRIESLREQKSERSNDRLDVNIAASRIGKKIFHIEEISKAYGDQTLIRNFSHIVLPEDRIGIIGVNGSGKTSLLNMLAGQILPDSGQIQVGQTVRIAYYTQENVELDESKRVLQYINEQAELIRTSDGTNISASQMLERFQFPADKQWVEIGRLSGGEKRRLYLLRTLMGQPNVLLLDEPTNDLDIQTLSLLEEYIDDFPGVVITVSHDRYFLDRIVDQLWIFDEDGHIQHFIGNYTEYNEKNVTQLRSKTELKNKSEEQVQVPSPKSHATSTPRKLSYKEQREWEEIEHKIADLEAQILQIQEEIQLSSSNYVELERLSAEEQRISSELDQAIERWTELSQLIEEIAKRKS